MNLAVIGSGGREHAICYKLRQSPKIKKLICIPGNAGIEEIAENVSVDISNFDLIYKILKKYKIDIVIVGPEKPLVDGLVNYLDKKKVKVTSDGYFAFGLDRDRKNDVVITINEKKIIKKVFKREYKIQRIDGLEEKK